MSSSVGIVGIGIMGSAMTTNLVEAGYEVVGFDLDPARMDALVAVGGIAAASPGDVAARVDTVITSLPSDAALEAVCTGADGVVEAARPGLMVVETSTLDLAVKERMHAALATAGAVLLDCPLSGTGAQAVTGDLSVYASGDEAAVRRCEPVFGAIARSSHYLGAFGNGMRMKLVANLLVAVHNVAAAEAMVLGMKAGLDPARVYDVIRDGAGTSRMFEVRGPMMVAGDYSGATMRIDMWRKDMRLIDEFARALGCPTPLLSATAPLYDEALADGRGREDTASVCAVLEKRAALER